MSWPVAQRFHLPDEYKLTGPPEDRDDVWVLRQMGSDGGIWRIHAKDDVAIVDCGLPDGGGSTVWIEVAYVDVVGKADIDVLTQAVGMISRLGDKVTLAVEEWYGEMLDDDDDEDYWPRDEGLPDYDTMMGRD